MSDRNITWGEHSVKMQDRESKYGHKSAAIWLTGLSGSGKSTVANALEKRLFESGYRTYLLDGDNMRHGLNSDLGFGDSDRAENIRRAAEVAKLFYDSGAIIICAFISPFLKDRSFARELFADGRFVETYLSTDIAVCAERDPKGLYKKANSGELKNFTGLDSGYEKPTNPELIIDTAVVGVDESVEIIYSFLTGGVI